MTDYFDITTFKKDLWGPNDSSGGLPRESVV